MAAIMNGIALHGGFIPYGGTFLTFSDYSRNAIRMAALMKQRVIHVFTHDSIGLGEDGPTHQSVEHAAALRLIPNLDVWRPCDTAETAVAWAAALEQPRAAERAAAVAPEPAVSRRRRGARRHRARRLRAGRAERGRPEEKAQAVIIATGSEVQLALHAQQQLGGAAASRCASSRCRRPRCSTARTRPTSASVLPRRRAARRGRGRRHRLLVEVRLRRGRRHRPLRRIGARPACCSSTSASRPTTSAATVQALRWPR